MLIRPGHAVKQQAILGALSPKVCSPPKHQQSSYLDKISVNFKVQTKCAEHVPQPSKPLIPVFPVGQQSANDAAISSDIINPSESFRTVQKCSECQSLGQDQEASKERLTFANSIRPLIMMNHRHFLILRNNCAIG